MLTVNLSIKAKQSCNKTSEGRGLYPSNVAYS